MRPLPPHISIFCASKLPILGITKVKHAEAGHQHSLGIGGNHAKAASSRNFLATIVAMAEESVATMPRRPSSRNFLLSGGAGGAWQRRSPVSESSEACSGATRENMSHNTYVAHSPDTISMHEHDGTGPELAPAPRRQLRPRDAGDRSRLRSARPELVRCRVCRRRFAKEPFACSGLLRVYLKDRECACGLRTHSLPHGENTARNAPLRSARRTLARTARQEMGRRPLSTPPHPLT